MAISDLYTEYSSYPGRQVVYMVVPRKYEPVFFEGVQSIDAASNADEVSHGQFGYKSDVLITRDYQNSSGTVNLKEFNNASYVLRAMTGVSPSASFIFDPSRLEHVDVFCNVWDKARTRVMRSSWFVDFTPSLSETDNLDEIQTKDIAYTAIRKIDFEGHQIVCQTFTGDQARDGATEFTLQYPALVDPVVQEAEKNLDGLRITGKGRHELCPFQYLLRVWVDGVVLDDPEQAAVVTTATPTTGAGGTTYSNPVSVVHLRDPLPDNGGDHIVKVMWLADGNAMIAQTGVTAAPVISSVILPTEAGGTTWSNELLRVVFSHDLADSLFDPSATPPGHLTTSDAVNDFKLTIADASGNVVFPSASPDSLNINVQVGTDYVITKNVVDLQFSGSSLSTGSYIGTLSYVGTALKDNDGITTPMHSKEFMITIS